MTIATTAPHDEETIAAEFDAVRDLFHGLIDNPPSADADEATKAKALDAAIVQARVLAHQFPTEPAGRPASAFLAALRAANDGFPRPKATTPNRPPQATIAAAKLASAVAANPELADELPAALTPALDGLLGSPVLARRAAAIEEANAQLANDAVEVLSRIPTDWRRAAGAPTPDEAAGLDQLRSIGVEA